MCNIYCATATLVRKHISCWGKIREIFIFLTRKLAGLEEMLSVVIMQVAIIQPRECIHMVFFVIKVDCQGSCVCVGMCVNKITFIELHT